LHRKTPFFHQNIMYNMKNIKHVLGFAWVLALLLPLSTLKANSGTPANAQDKRTVLVERLLSQQDISSSEQLYESKALKRAGKVAKKLGFAKGKDKVDFQSDPDRWLWFWLFGWGLALIISILSVFTFGPLWYLSSLLWAAGSVCAIIFLLKKTGAID
jgi:hypothetical protein